jgi:hypothetical protein
LFIHHFTSISILPLYLRGIRVKAVKILKDPDLWRFEARGAEYSLIQTLRKVGNSRKSRSGDGDRETILALETLLFEHQVFSERALDALRRVASIHAARISRFSVLVEFGPPTSQIRSGPRRYMRPYVVYASSRRNAKRYIHEFAKRSDPGFKMRILSVKRDHWWWQTFSEYPGVALFSYLFYELSP